MLLLHLFLNRWVKFLAAFSIVYAALFGLVGGVSADPVVETDPNTTVKVDSCCLYFQSVPSSACFATNLPYTLNTKGYVKSGKQAFPCKQSGDDLVLGVDVPVNFVGAYQTSDKSCLSTISYSSDFASLDDQQYLLELSGGKKTNDLDVKIEISSWCETGMNLHNKSTYVPNFSKELSQAIVKAKEDEKAAADASKPWVVLQSQEAAFNKEFKGCCTYYEGSGPSNQCVTIKDLLKNGSNAKKFDCKTYKDKMVNFNLQIVPHNFLGGYPTKENIKDGPNCNPFTNSGATLNYTKYDTQQKTDFSFKKDIDTSEFCVTAFDVMGQTKLFDYFQGEEKKTEGVLPAMEKLVKDYFDSKKKKFCCIPSKKSADTACHVPLYNDADIKKLAEMFAGTKASDSSFDAKSVLDIWWNDTAGDKYKAGTVFASNFFSCTPKNTVINTDTGAGFKPIDKKVSVTDFWMLTQDCKSTTILPVTDAWGNDVKPCNDGDQSCLDSYAKKYPSGMSGLTAAKRCAAPNLFCLCNSKDCVDTIYLSKVKITGAEKDSKSCDEAAKTAEPSEGWKCKKTTHDSIVDPSKTAADGTKGVESCCMLSPDKKCKNTFTTKLDKFECGDGKKVPIVTPAIQEQVLLKQVCTACQTKTVKLKDGEKDCTVVTELPDIGAFPNPLGQSGINNPQSFIANLIKTFLGILGSIALALVVYGGFTWMTSAGIPERVEAGRKTVQWAAFGLVAVFASYTLVKFIFDALG